MVNYFHEAKREVGECHNRSKICNCLQTWYNVYVPCIRIRLATRSPLQSLEWQLMGSQCYRSAVCDAAIRSLRLQTTKFAVPDGDMPPLLSAILGLHLHNILPRFGSP